MRHSTVLVWYFALDTVTMTGSNTNDSTYMFLPQCPSAKAVRLAVWRQAVSCRTPVTGGAHARKSCKLFSRHPFCIISLSEVVSCHLLLRLVLGTHRGFVRSGCRSCAWQCCRDGGGDDCGCGWCSCQRVWSLRVVDGSLCGILSGRVPLADLLLQFVMCDCVGP